MNNFAEPSCQLPGISRADYDAAISSLRRCVPWLGRLIADGGHLNSVAPNDAIGALRQAEDLLAKLSTK